MLTLKIVSLVAILPAFVAAQNTAGIPTCALTCTLNNAASSACGGISDVKCLCTDQSLQAKIAACLQTSCTNPADLQTAIAGGAAQCAQFGVTIGTSLGPASTTSSSVASAGASKTSGTSSTPTSSSSSTSASVAAVPPSTTSRPNSALRTGNAGAACAILGAAVLAALIL